MTTSSIAAPWSSWLRVFLPSGLPILLTLVAVASTVSELVRPPLNAYGQPTCGNGFIGLIFVGLVVAPIAVLLSAFFTKAREAAIERTVTGLLTAGGGVALASLVGLQTLAVVLCFGGAVAIPYFVAR